MGWGASKLNTSSSLFRTFPSMTYSLDSDISSSDVSSCSLRNIYSPKAFLDPVDESMRFLVRLMNGHRFMPKDSRTLTLTAYDLIKSLGADVGNLRVSATAVELDILVPSKEVMDRSLTRLIKIFGESLTIRELDVPTQVPNPRRAVRDGIALFNEERYWESHESLEAAWRSATGVEREVLQGIILLAASLVHLQKDEHDIALSILKRADPKLPQQGTMFGIDLSELKQRVKMILVDNRPAFFKLPVNGSDS